MLHSLAYLGFSSPRASEWLTYGPEVLGLQVADDQDDGVVRLRMDDAAYRISVGEAEADSLDHVGWTVTGPRQFVEAIAKLEDAGVAVTRESAEVADSRCVAELASFEDPFGWRQELCWGLASRQGSFRPGRVMSHFVTGDQGLGHIVFVVPSLAEAERFYCDILGFKLSDETRENGMQIRFYRCNTRHHSLALAEFPGMTGVAHLMLEVGSLDDVGTAMEAVEARGDLLLTLGRHSNDHMVSFYCDTPVGVPLEYGWGATEVPDDGTTTMIDTGDIWGHAPVRGSWPPPALIRPVEPSTEPTEA